MARPKKIGLEYFSLDISLDPKVEYIETMHEAEGFYFWIKTLQRIYANGYFIEWSKYQAASMKKQTGIDLDKIEEILSSCLEVGLFDQELFDRYQIITSRGVQKRFYTAAQKRKEVEIVPEYVLHQELFKWSDDIIAEETYHKLLENNVSDVVVSGETMVEVQSEGSYCRINPVETPLEVQSNDSCNEVNSVECRQSTGISTQSKVKESKGKNSKAKRDKTSAPKIPKITYAENVLMTEAECKKLIDKHGQAATDWMIDALDNYKGAHGKKYASDYRAILSWVVGKYEEQVTKAQKPAERSESNDRNGSDYAGRDWSSY